MPFSTSFPLNTLLHSASIISSPARHISTTLAPGLHMAITAASVAGAGTGGTRLGSRLPVPAAPSAKLAGAGEPRGRESATRRRREQGLGDRATKAAPGERG